MRVLVIEDDPDIAGFVKNSLEENSFAVDVAADGEIGEEMACVEGYDLIVLDLMLPGKDGLLVLKSVRRAGFTMPVLILTARGAVSDRVAGLDAGADDYLVKPFAVAELRARIRALIRRKSEDKQVVLTAGDLSLNTVSHEVRVNASVVELTAREYAILEYLLHNKNHLLSKGMIAEHVWDYHFDSDYNLIEVYIKRIRRKLEKKSDDRLIHTVRNGGYIIRDVEKNA